MAKTTSIKKKARLKLPSIGSAKKNKRSKKSIIGRLTSKQRFIVVALVFAVVGTALILQSYAATPLTKPTFENTGVQKGVVLKKQGGTTITKDNTVLENIEFSSSVQIKANNVKLNNVRILGSGAYGLKVVNGFKGISIDHAEITCPSCREGDVGQNGKAIYASNFTVKNSQLSKFGDGIYSEIGNALIESNIFYGNQRLSNSKGDSDHTDGIQMNSGSNVTIRNNVFVTDFHKDYDMGSNFMIQNIFGPVNNILIEDNYLSGGNFTASIGNRDYGFPAMTNVVVRNNTFAKDTWKYGAIHTSGLGCDPGIKYINNQYDSGEIIDTCFNDPNYSPGADNYTPPAIPDASGSGTTNQDPTPTPTTPSPSTSPAPSSDLPASYDFKSGISGWDGQGNTSLSHNGSEGSISAGALKVTVDKNGPYPDNSKTARAGTTQYEKGLKANSGDEISASLAVKSSTQRKVRCELRFYNGRKILATIPGSFDDAYSDWTTRSCTATAPNGTTNVALRFYAEGANYGEVFYLDDAQIDNGATLLDATPITPDTTPTTPDTAEPIPSSPSEPATTPVSKDTTAPSKPNKLTRSASFNWGSFSYAINLDWEPSTDNVGVTGYIVTKNGKQITNTIKTGYSDSNVSANTLYTYKVQAVDAAGNKSSDATTTAEGSCFLFWCSLR